MLLNRRTLIASIAAAAASSGCPASAQAKLLGLDDRNLVRRVRYRGNDGLIFWWIKGEYLAEIESELTPLFGMAYGSIQQVMGRADGGFDVLQLELAFRTDLKTGERISSFTNPVTGEIFAMPFAPIGPTTVHYSDRAIPAIPREFHGSTIDFQAYPGAPYAVGDALFLPYRAVSKVSTPGQRVRIVNDVATFQSPLGKALNPKIRTSPATMFCSDVNSFPGWLRMGERTGSLVMRGHGAKCLSITDMPENWKAMVNGFDPLILTDPTAALKRPSRPYSG